MLRDVTTFQHGNGMNIQAFLDTYGKFFKNSRKQHEIKRLDRVKFINGGLLTQNLLAKFKL